MNAEIVAELHQARGIWAEHSSRRGQNQGESIGCPWTAKGRRLPRAPVTRSPERAVPAREG